MQWLRRGSHWLSTLLSTPWRPGLPAHSSHQAEPRFAGDPIPSPGQPRPGRAVCSAPRWLGTPLLRLVGGTPRSPPPGLRGTEPTSPQQAARYYELTHTPAGVRDIEWPGCDQRPTEPSFSPRPGREGGRRRHPVNSPGVSPLPWVPVTAPLFCVLYKCIHTYQ